MSLAILSTVWRVPLTAAQKVVMVSLADQADDAGYCWPSFQHTADRTGLSRRSVIRAVAELETAGFIVREVRINNRKHTSNGYRIDHDALLMKMAVGGDTLSLSGDTVSPLDDYSSDTTSPGSDTVSPGVVTECHQGSDTVSPKSSSNLQLNHQGEPTRARANGVGGSPPLVVSRPRGLRTEPEAPQPNGYEPPDPERLAIGAMANAITEVTGVSARLNWQEVGGLAAELVTAGYTADQLRTHYGRSPTAGAWHWFDQHWKGKKGDQPTLKDIRETIAGAAHTAAEPVRKLPAWQRALALSQLRPATGDT